jgi:chaperonin cofactor prefoldin
MSFIVQMAQWNVQNQQAYDDGLARMEMNKYNVQVKKYETDKALAEYSKESMNIQKAVGDVNAIVKNKAAASGISNRGSVLDLQLQNKFNAEKEIIKTQQKARAIEYRNQAEIKMTEYENDVIRKKLSSPLMRFSNSSLRV